MYVNYTVHTWILWKLEMFFAPSFFGEMSMFCWKHDNLKMSCFPRNHPTTWSFFSKGRQGPSTACVHHVFFCFSCSLVCVDSEYEKNRGGQKIVILMMLQCIGIVLLLYHSWLIAAINAKECFFWTPPCLQAYWVDMHIPWCLRNWRMDNDTVI